MMAAAGRGPRHRTAPIRRPPFIMPNDDGASLGSRLRAAPRLIHHASKSATRRLSPPPGSPMSLR